MPVVILSKISISLSMLYSSMIPLGGPRLPLLIGSAVSVPSHSCTVLKYCTHA